MIPWGWAVGTFVLGTLWGLFLIYAVHRLSAERDRHDELGHDDDERWGG